MIKRNHRIKNKYPFSEREEFVKTAKKITCELFFFDFDWIPEREIFKRHREFDKQHPKLANNYSTRQIKNGIEKWIKLGYLNKRVI